MRDESPGHWRDAVLARLADLRLDAAREAEIVEELAQHLDARYEELRAAGSGEDEARSLAIAELSDDGELAQRLSLLARAHVPPPIVPGQPVQRLFGGLWQDVRDAVRLTRKQPAFTAAVVVTLGLGIAVNTTVFTLVNGALLRPMPFEGIERFVELGVRNTGNAERPVADMSYLDLQDWQAADETFEGIIASRDDISVDLSGDGRPPARVPTAFVSWNAFPLIGERPVLGRDFTATDDRVGAPPVVVLSERLWRARYGSDPAIAGTTVRVAGVPSTVLGVMPPGFAFPYDAQIWRPLAALPPETREARDARLLDAMGRLRPGATVEQATAELSGITAALTERHPETNRDTAPRVEPLAGIAAPLVAVMMALLGAVGFVLLIACANVANLLLARAAARSRDVTVRLALGASRWRVSRQLLVESLLLAAAGGVCGLALAAVGVRFFRQAAADPAAAPPYWIDFPIDGAVLTYLIVLCAGSALLCGLVPAWHASRTSLAATLNEAGRSSTGGRSRRRWTGAFVIAQVALALVLLTGAVRMTQGLVRAVRTDVGVDIGAIVQMSFDLRASHDARERRLLFLDRLDARLIASPGVDAALAGVAPMAGAAALGLHVDGRPAPGTGPPLVSLLPIGQGYFEAVGAPLLEGRALGADDLRLGDRVIVNERLARMHFPDEPAVGRRIRLESLDAGTAIFGDLPWMTIVGVAANVRQRTLPSGEFDPVAYIPYTLAPPPFMTVLARSASGAGAATTFVQEEVAALDPDMPLFGVSTVRDALMSRLWAERLFGSLFAAFALIALVLATCGLYAVTAYAVSRRTREIGVRLALGADAPRIWWTVTGTTLRQLGIGVALGTAGAAALSAALPAILVGDDRWNPWVFLGMALLLVMTGLVASAVPARRATRVPPTVALQAE
jgi:predicted permease